MPIEAQARFSALDRLGVPLGAALPKDRTLRPFAPSRLRAFA
ncbi:MAG TPA: hypothetical protein VF645_06965 [Allosphingosinicella sp.]|jgi:hypothetical protein